MPPHSLVFPRCSTIVLRRNAVLLVRRRAFVLDTIAPSDGQRVIEPVFLSPDQPSGQPRAVEAGMWPEFVTLDRLSSVGLRPPLAGHIKALHGTPHPRTAPYLGNMWRPAAIDGVGE